MGGVGLGTRRKGVRGRGGWCGMRYTEEGDEGKGWVVWDEVHGGRG